MASPSPDNCVLCINHHPIVFIDSKVDDYQSLVNGAIPQAEVIVLNPTLDGVSQITSALVGRKDISTIHIVCHGAPGCLDLGNSKLSLDTLEYYASQLESWTSDSSVPLLLYGCNVALGDAGSEFLEKLHHLTGCAIAATAKRIGNAKGGNWQLEVNIGDFSPEEMGNQPLAFTATAQAAYQGIFGSITRVSVTLDGTQGNNGSSNPALDASGSLVAFESDASNLVAGDTNGITDVFVRNLLTGTITRVSVANDGTQGNSSSISPFIRSQSANPAISDDGRFVTFQSTSSNLVAGDTNGITDIFIRDLLTGTTTRVSVANNGTQGDGISSNPAISASGRFVAFDSNARNLVAGDTNGSTDIFVRDLLTGTITRVSVALDGTQGNSGSFSPAISADGRFVAFESNASNLVALDTNGITDIFVRNLLTGTTTQVSVANDGTQGNGISSNPAISADGRFVAFESDASNLVESDTNNSPDIFIRDLQTGTITRVSVALDGTEGNNSSSNAAISASGRFVVFSSDASNLVAGDTNNSPDFFVRDRQTGTITLVSVPDDGTLGNGGSFGSAISDDGLFVAFSSSANNLVAGDTNNSEDIFVRGTNNIPNNFSSNASIEYTATRVSVADNSTQGNRDSFVPTISGNGRFVAFQSSASNLVAGDINDDGDDIFVRDRQTGITTLVSVALNGTQGNGGSSNATISAEGRFVAFSSTASNLVAGDTNDSDDIFVRNLQTGTTTRVSIALNGTQGNGGSSNPAISASGQFVAFSSTASNLVAGDTNNNDDIFVRDLLTGTTTRVSVANDGTQGNDSFELAFLSSNPAISDDGRFVAFQSRANNLVAGDTNNSDDIFVRDRQTGTTTRVSVANDGTEANNSLGLGLSNALSSNPVISGDGRFVAFQSFADNLVARDTNNSRDIFVRDLQTGTTSLISFADARTLGNNESFNPAISADGRFVAFDSLANNLVARDTNNRSDIFVLEINNI